MELEKINLDKWKYVIKVCKDLLEMKDLLRQSLATFKWQLNMRSQSTQPK
jgi:hypothetical protein